MINLKNIVISIVVITGLILFFLFTNGLIGLSNQIDEKQQVSLAIAKVEIRDLKQYEELDGTLGYGETVQIKPSNSGILTQITKEGSELERGSIIFKFFRAASENSLLSADQQVASASASVAQAELNLENLTKPPTQAQIASSDASVAQAELNLENLTKPPTQAQVASLDASLAQASNSLIGNQRQSETRKTALRIARKNYCDAAEALNVKYWALQQSICPEDGDKMSEDSIKNLYDNIFLHEGLLTLGNALLSADANYRSALESIKSSESSLTSAQEQRSALDNPPTDTQLAQARASLVSAQMALRTAHGNRNSLTEGTSAATVMYGNIPAWRDFKENMTPGEDIRQLETNLLVLGYLPEQHLSVNEEFDDTTYKAIRKMQEKIGVEVTGSIFLGDIIFLPGQSVVEFSSNFPVTGTNINQSTSIVSVTPVENTTTIIDENGNLFINQTSLQKVETTIEVANKDLIQQGSKVKIELPDESELSGTVEEIGKIAVTPQGNQAGNPYLEMSISIDGDVSYPQWTGAPVTVSVTKELAENVLAVPVSSLISLLDGGYALEVVDGGVPKLVPINVGMYSDGWVQIESAGMYGDIIEEGYEVVMPK